MASATSLKTGSPLGTHSLARYRSEFPIFRDKVYLNTCSLGALGERTRRRLGEFLDLWQARGAAAWYDEWWAALAQLRRRHGRDRKSTRLNSSHSPISYARFCLKKKKRRTESAGHPCPGDAA